MESLEGDRARHGPRDGDRADHRARRRQLVGLEAGGCSTDFVAGERALGPAPEGGHRGARRAADAGRAGAAVGAAGGAIAGGGKGAGKGAAIGGVVGAGGGTLYGLNENKKNDEKYKAAYSSCMHSRGYTG